MEYAAIIYLTTVLSKIHVIAFTVGALSFALSGVNFIFNVEFEKGVESETGLPKISPKAKRTSKILMIIAVIAGSIALFIPSGRNIEKMFYGYIAQEVIVFSKDIEGLKEIPQNLVDIANAFADQVKKDSK
jgi:hypothetical protein